MSDYRRALIHGGTFFFTVKTEGNSPIFSAKSSVTLLGEVIREAKSLWEFEINAIVLLPDHLHTIWSLRSGDCEYSKRWGWIKKEFTKRYLKRGGDEKPVSESKKSYRRKGVWQRRFWEHTIQDEDDFQMHFDYIHWNPVKHQYVQSVADWPHSSFHRWVDQGVYDAGWGGDLIREKFATLKHDFGE